MHRELLEGALVVLPPPKSGHSKIAKRVFRALLACEAKKTGFAYTEAGYTLSDDPPNWVQPDVSFVSWVHGSKIADTEYFRGAPELAVEVISPSESASDIERKISLMLAGGTLTVWAIYPESRNVHVHLPDGSSFRRVTGQTLTAQILPDFELPVDKIFED